MLVPPSAAMIGSRCCCRRCEGYSIVDALLWRMIRDYSLSLCRKVIYQRVTGKRTENAEQGDGAIPENNIWANAFAAALGYQLVEGWCSGCFRVTDPYDVLFCHRKMDKLSG